MSDSVNRAQDSELSIISAIAASDQDCPVLMMNMNKYKPEAGFPGGDLYESYMGVLADLLRQVGAKILWRSASYGQPVGDHDIDEILAVWFPSHQAWLNLSNLPDAKENFRLRKLSVQSAVIHRCDGKATFD